MIGQNRGFTEAYKQPNSYFTTVITFCKRARKSNVFRSLFFVTGTSLLFISNLIYHTNPARTKHLLSSTTRSTHPLIMLHSINCTCLSSSFKNSASLACSTMRWDELMRNATFYPHRFLPQLRWRLDAKMLLIYSCAVI